MKHSVVFLRSLITALCWAVISAIFVIPCLVLAFLPAPGRYQNRFFFWCATWWGRLFFLTAGIKLQVSGEALAADDEPAIVAMNHASALDIMVAEVVLGTQPRMWLSTDAYKSIPLLSTLLNRMHVTVDTSSPRAAARSLARLRTLARGTVSHVLLFPEGRRWADDQIHDFFGGFAVLARTLKRPVRPVYIGSAHHVLPPKAMLVDNRTWVSVVVGPLMRMQEGESDAQFMVRVRDWFVRRVPAEVARREGWSSRT